MDTLQWLTETEFGKCIFTMLVSMVPIIELRGGLPFGVALGLPYHLAFPAAVLGNLIPAPFIIVYIRRIFELMRKYLPRLNGLVDQLEEKAHLDRLAGRRVSGDAAEKGHACGHPGRSHCRGHHAGPHPCGDQPVFRGGVTDSVSIPGWDT